MSQQAMVFTVGKDLFPGPGNTCDACKRSLQAGQRVYVLTQLATPWKSEDDEDHSWVSYVWHHGCDEGGA